MDRQGRLNKEWELAEEFVHTAFVEDFKHKIPRHVLFEMFLKAGLDTEWDIIRDCIENWREELDLADP